MFLALRQYTLPLLLALALHAAAALALYQGWSPEKETLNVIKPRAVVANLLVLEPKAMPKPVAPQPKPVAQPQAQPRRSLRSLKPTPPKKRARRRRRKRRSVKPRLKRRRRSRPRRRRSVQSGWRA